MIDSKGFRLERLSVSLGRAGLVLNDIDLEIPPKGIISIIGESGSGKSILGEAMFNFLPSVAEVSGTISFDGETLYRAKDSYFGRHWGLIPQMPQLALNPIRKIKKQLYDALRGAGLDPLTDSEIGEVLQEFSLFEPARVLNAYPYELSGGMLQRVLCVMIALTSPRWILADEPTKGLDDEAKTGVANNLDKLAKLTGATIVLITHDTSLAKALSNRIIMLYKGYIVEDSDVILDKPLHPYTKAFLAALPENGFNPLPPKRELPEGNRYMLCPYLERCPVAIKSCFLQIPPLIKAGDAQKVRCFLYDH